MSNLFHRRAIAVALIAVSAAGGAAFAAQADLTAAGVRLTPAIAAQGYQLRVTGPGGYVFERTYPKATALDVAMPAGGWADGAYRYEIVAQHGAALSRAGGEVPAAPAQAESGSFRIEGGIVYLADALATRNDNGTNSLPGTNDQVIGEDLIVQGSVCAGFDCVNNELFSGDTVRIKENNTRIRFLDTSILPGFPATDWQLTANDFGVGGQNKFSLEDLTAATVPFAVAGGAPTNAVFVDPAGRVGLGTSTPAHEMHMSSGDTPTIRFDQNGSLFPLQVWDVGGNEVNFFIRDTTGGGTLPFLIRPGAPTGSFIMSAAGQVGLGTASPSAQLHVLNDTGAVTGRDLLRIENNGPTRMRLRNSVTGNEWSLNAHDSDFRVTVAGAALPSMTIFPNGNVTITGTLTQGSDRNSKENFRPLDRKALLGKIAKLDITEWNFKSESEGVRHIGPMAQDFRSVFGLGDRDDRIAPLDTSGVALAAVQGLLQEIAARDERIARLESRDERVAELEQRLDAMSRLLARVQEAHAQAMPAGLASGCRADAVATAAGL